jgi:hypothetical protein
VVAPLSMWLLQAVFRAPPSAIVRAMAASLDIFLGSIHSCKSKGWGVEPLRHSPARLAPSSAALRLSLIWVNTIASMLCRCGFKETKSLCVLG